jgi:hypothetical protein
MSLFYRLAYLQNVAEKMTPSLINFPFLFFAKKFVPGKDDYKQNAPNVKRVLEFV